MKTDKNKLHQHRKVKKLAHPVEGLAPDSVASSELDLMLYRIERSPKQENL